MLALEDGRQIRVSDDVFKSPEIMFSETHFNYANRGSKDYIKFKGISQLIYDTINSFDLTMRKSMFRSIIFCGGNTSYPGFLERTIDEIKGLANTKVHGEGDQTRNNMSDVLSTCFTSIYVGGCVLSK